MIWFIIYFTLGVMITIFLLGLDFKLNWSLSNIIPMFKGYELKLKVFFLTLPVTWILVVIYAYIGLIIG